MTDCMNVNLYRYYIGREGQSVNEDIMMSKILLDI